MKVTDHGIVLEPGELITISPFPSGLRSVGPASSRVFQAPRRPGRIQFALASAGEITLRSEDGRIARLPAGLAMVSFIVEPHPDVWYCENDDGNPLHPVSKGDVACPMCGGRVFHG